MFEKENLSDCIRKSAAHCASMYVFLKSFERVHVGCSRALQRFLLMELVSFLAAGFRLYFCWGLSFSVFVEDWILSTKTVGVDACRSPIEGWVCINDR